MRSLFYREMPRGEDVAEAIHAIVTRSALPRAIGKEGVLTELLMMSRTKDDGEVVEQSASAKRFVELSYRNVLSESSVFQSGYERYEANSDYGNHPVIPVSDFFFRYIYSENEDLRQTLDAMLPHEIMQSLPKRPSTPRDQDLAPIIEAENNPTKVGKIAGIVILRNGDANCRLLATWLDRKAKTANGMINSVTNHLEHAHGERVVKRMRTTARNLQIGMDQGVERVRGSKEAC
jgi:hypothetical protein